MDDQKFQWITPINVNIKYSVEKNQRIYSGGCHNWGKGHSFMLLMWGRATGKGMVSCLSALNRVNDFRQVCPNQGLNLS